MTGWTQITKKRRVTVKKYGKSVLVDIREFYLDDNDDLKPGRKGISLTAEQFKTFVEMKDEIAEAIEEIES